MCVGPGFSSVATRNALRTISGIARIRSTRVFHFVTGSSIRTMSTTWCASLWSLVEAAWPVMATIGARSRYASATPVMRLVAPGPRVAIATAARPVKPTMDVGHERGALLVARRDVADALVTRQRVEDVHRLLAGHGEDEVTALGRETVDEEVGSSPRRIAGHDT